MNWFDLLYYAFMMKFYESGSQKESSRFLEYCSVLLAVIFFNIILFSQS